MQRRVFLTGAAAALAGLRRNVMAQATLDGGVPAAAGADKLARLSIMTYNFTSRLKLEGQPPSPERTIDIFDLPQLYVDTFGLHNIELQHSHFASTATPYLREFRARIEKAKSRMTQINVEFGQMNISAVDPVQRYQGVDLTIDWVDHAAVLGCPRVMINQGQLTPETKENATVALKLMSDYGKSKGVKISVETRGSGRGRGRGADATAPAPPPAPPPGPPAWELIREVVEATGAYSNVDIGNVGAPDQASIHTVIKGLLASSSGNMHIKTSPNWDLGTAIRYTNRELGYKGLYSIEVSPPQIRSVYDTILANL
jgi:hypothetical protein